METIRMIFQVTIELLIIASFVPIIIHGLRDLRAWAHGEKEEEEEGEDPPRNIKENL